MSLKQEERDIMVGLELEKADYNCFFKVSEADVLARIKPTRALIEKIRKYISDKQTL